MHSSILILSPHPDDAAINLGGLISALSKRKPAIRVMTFFTRSAYAPGREDIEDNIAAVSACRRAEEEAFAEAASAELEYLDLNDSSVEGMDGVQERQASPDSDPRCAAVNAALENLSPRLVLVPAGIGGHVDHLIVKMCAVARFRNKIPMLFYEELPYASYFSEEGLDEEILSRLGPARTEVRLPITHYVEKKRALLRCYPSQILPEREALILDYARRFGQGSIERVWHEKDDQAAADAASGLLKYCAPQ